jgi:hypothetical protein
VKFSRRCAGAGIAGPAYSQDDFMEEAQAFLHDDEPLDFTWENEEQYLEMRDGSRVPVNVGGYWKPPVASYYRQKCQAGLYQALHRIRPYTEREYDRHIFIFTNMPIPGVKVDHLLRDAEVERIAGRLEQVIAALDDRLAAKGECKVPELANLLTNEGESPRTVGQWIGKRAVALAEATGSTFIPGKGRHPGCFARRVE